MNRNQVIPNARGTRARAKKPKTKAEDLAKRYQDLLEIARLVSWCMNRDHLIKTCLDHINQRLGKRARYLLMEGDELKLHCWVGRYACPIEQVPVHKESIVWKIVEKGIPLNLTDPKRDRRLPAYPGRGGQDQVRYSSPVCGFTDSRGNKGGGLNRRFR